MIFQRLRVKTALAVLAVGACAVWILFDRLHLEPLIFLSTASNPNDDQELRQKLDLPRDAAVNFGSNRFDGRRFAVLSGTAADRDSYAVMRQLAKFIIENSVYTRGGGRVPPLRQFVRDLFYSDEPLPLSCGKASSFLRKLASSSMNVGKERIRCIDLFEQQALRPSSIRTDSWWAGNSGRDVFP